MLQRFIALSFTLICIPALGSSPAADMKAQVAERGQTDTQVVMPKPGKKLSWDEAAKFISECDEKALVGALAANSIDLGEQAESVWSGWLHISHNQLLALIALHGCLLREQSKDDLRKIELLIKAGSDVDSLSGNEYDSDNPKTPIMASARVLSPEAIRLLVRYKADPFKKNDRGEGALHVLYNEPRMTLSDGVEYMITLSNGTYYSDVGMANYHQRLRMVLKMLLVLGLDIHGQDNKQLTPVQVALTNLDAPRSSLQGVLVEYGANHDMSDTMKECIVRKRILRGDVGRIKGHERFIREQAAEQLARAHEKFNKAMQEQLGRLRVGVQGAFAETPGCEVLYEDPQGLISIINGYAGRTLFSAMEDPLIAETVELMERNQATKAATAVVAPKQ